MFDIKIIFPDLKLKIKKLFSDLYPAKFLDTLPKSFFLCDLSS